MTEVTVRPSLWIKYVCYNCSEAASMTTVYWALQSIQSMLKYLVICMYAFVGLHKILLSTELHNWHLSFSVKTTVANIKFIC